jgi:hypothetical protein
MAGLRPAFFNNMGRIWKNLGSYLHILHLAGRVVKNVPFIGFTRLAEDCQPHLFLGS